MADVPSPHRPVDLIMQGAQGLGAGIGQWAQDTAPGDPILDKYINRLLAGEDPNQLANEARNDQVFQMMLAELRKGQRAPIDPAQRTPDVGYAKGQQYPTVQQPGAMNPVAGGLANVQQGGGAWNPNRPLLSGQQPAPQQGLGAMTEQPPARAPAPAAPPSGGIGLQPGEESFRTVSVQAPPWQAGYTQSELAGGPQPAAQPQTPAPNAALSMPQPRPQPAQAPAQRPPQQDAAPAQPKARTAREQQRIMQFLPAVAAAQGRENVATIKAQSAERVAQQRNDVTAALGMLKERGLDTGRMEKMLEIATKLPLDAQIAVMKEMGLQMRAEWETQTKRQGIAQKGTKQDWERLKGVQRRIMNLENKISNIYGRAMGGKLSADAQKEVEATKSELGVLQQHEADLSKMFAPSYESPAPATPGTPPSPGFLGFGGSPGTPAQPQLTPGGKPYDNVITDQASGTIIYMMGGQPVETVSTRNPASQP